ncbi:hypothetical protein BDK51DRAFT_30963 [Blyttiomyces helicus]|uniref:Protein FAM184A/B N-terminal domain-containing protein n=1 Tax=Blyttiomyces helicus TaxID=388810 RepID=A0A4P9WS86_9FUNG|nr:hypothetical protein BDK51DRAFT_30963 [Blyttiomyces helicus]|eukprot:RKO94808.1 hypothetical protein BDK51DRAFT_30963 [Blyttiomyces helicus]
MDSPGGHSITSRQHTRQLFTQPFERRALFWHPLESLGDSMASRRRSSARKSQSQSDRDADATTASSGTLAKGVSASPEIAFRMCKKIAQLTKVIYYLNTKIEDHNVEIQSQAEAYEDEINDVIKDGQSQLERLVRKQEECEHRLIAQEEFIKVESFAFHSNAGNSTKLLWEKIGEKDAQLEELSKEKVALQEFIEESNRDREVLESTFQQKINGMSRSLEVLGEAEANRDVQEASHQERLEGTVRDHKKAIEDIRRQAAIDIEEVRAEYSKKIKSMNDERARSDETMKESLAVARKKVYSRYRIGMKYCDPLIEDDARVAECKLQQLQEELDKQKQESQAAYENLEKRMTQAYEEESAKVAQLKETVAAMEVDVEMYGLRAQAVIVGAEIKRIELKMKLRLEEFDAVSSLLTSTTTILSLREKELEAAVDRQNTAEYNCAEMKLELELLSDEHKSLKASHSETLEQLKAVKAELENNVSDLESAVETIRMLTNQVDLAQKRQDDLRELCEAKDKQLYAQIEKMEAANEKAAHDLRVALANLKEELEAAHRQHLAQELQKLGAVHEEILNDRDKRITALQHQLQEEVKNFQKKLREELEPIMREKADLQFHIENLLEEKSMLDSSLRITQANLEEKIVEIAEYLGQIQTQSVTIRDLEVDKADLFQKMVHVDEQVRGELLEKFEREKERLIDAMEMKASVTLGVLRDELNNHWSKELSVALVAKEGEYQSQRRKLEEEHAAAIEALNKELEKKDIGLATMQYEKNAALTQIQYLTQAHAAQMQSVMAEGKKTLEEKRQSWEAEAQARDTQLKVQSTIALASLEKKHQAAREEMEVNQKKQLDELRNFHNMSGLAAKKEAETQRLNEINKLKAQHEEEIAKLMEDHKNEMEAETEAANGRHAEEISNISEAYEHTIKVKEDRISELLHEVEIYVAKEKALDIRVHECEYDIEQLKDQIKSKNEDIARIKNEAAQDLKDLESDLLEQQKDDIDRLNEEHLEESQRMLRDFENAQAFLKKQIANHIKSIEDAEVRYINREPRAVDLQRIEELEEDIKRRKRKIAQLMVTPLVERL